MLHVVPPMHITVLSMHTSPLDQPGAGDAGGLNVFVLQSALALARQGHTVTAFTRSREPFTSSPAPGVVVHGLCVGGSRPLSKEQLPRLVPEFAAAVLEHADHDPAGPLHSHYWLSGYAAQLMRRKRTGPWVHTMHTTAARKLRHAPLSSEVAHRADHERTLAHAADALTANTKADRLELAEDLGIGLERIHVITPGLDTHVFSPSGPAAPWPTSAPGLRLLFAGRLQSYKGPQVAIAALGLLRERGLAATLTLVGERSGAAPFDVAALAEEAGVKDAVFVRPPVPQPELAQWYRAADLLLMPSSHETFGLVAAEAQAVGTPVVAHAVGGLRTIVTDGVDGALIDSLEATQWAAALEPLARNGVPEPWRAAAIATAGHRGWASSARKLARLYAQLSPVSPSGSRSVAPGLR